MTVESNEQTTKPTTEVAQEPQSPNEGWQNDPNLDENGNPVETTKETTQEPVKESTAPESAEEAESKPELEEGEASEEIKEPREYNLDTPVVKQVEKLLAEAGLNAVEVGTAINENGGKVTPEIIKAIADKHGDAVASIVTEQLKDFHKSASAKAQKKDQAIYDQVQDAFKGVTDQGGKETWAELAGWAKENVPNEERIQINKLLQQGGLAAKYAIDDLVNRFKTSDTFGVQADLMAGDNVVQTTGASPLSKSDYSREFRALEAKGHVYGESAELAALDKRRMAGIQRGI